MCDVFDHLSGGFDAVGQVHAQAGLGDRQEGLALAQQVCSECHAIRGGQVSDLKRLPLR